MGLKTRIKALAQQQPPSTGIVSQGMDFSMLGRRDEGDQNITCEEIQLLIEGDNADDDDFTQPREDVEYGATMVGFRQ